MIRIRKAHERGKTDFGWLDSRHTFSFGRYFDPEHTGFRALLVMNDDRVAPGAGFGEHPHSDMEILSFVLEGAMTHRDSMGHESTIAAGEVQRMSAGRGVTHSEFNASDSDPLRFYQVWIEPDRRGTEPEYGQEAFDVRPGEWTLAAAPAGNPEANGALRLLQDVRIHLGLATAEAPLCYEPEDGRHLWVQILEGAATVNGQALQTGDGAAISGESGISIATDSQARALLFDLK